MKDYFKLETAINNLWQTADEMELMFDNLYEEIGDSKAADAFANVALGIMELHKFRMRKLDLEFNKFFELNEFCTDPEMLKLREEMFNRMKQSFSDFHDIPVKDDTKKKAVKKPAKMKDKKK